MSWRQTITPTQPNKETPLVEMLRGVEWASLLSNNPATTSGLTFGVNGGVMLVDGALTTIADQTTLLDASSTCYVEATRAGVISDNTTGFTAGKMPLFVVTTSASGVASFVDWRVWQDLPGIHGRASVAVTTVDVTLSAAQARCDIINVTGTLTGNRNLIVPDGPQMWTVTNNTAGAFTLTVKTSAGTGVAITQGKAAEVLADGTNVILSNNDAAAIGGALLAANNLSDLANAGTARTNLGLAIGTNVQAYDAELAALAGLTSAADKGIQFSGAGTAATFDLTAAGKALIDDADAAAQRTTLGLGNVDNTADASKPVSTAQAAADAAVLAAAETYADGLVVGLWDDRGSYNASGNAFPSSGGSGSAGAIKKGDIWTISVAGTLGGTAAYVGDLVRALVDTPGSTAANWSLTAHDTGYVAENASNKDASGGYAGLTLFKLNLRNAANTITSWFTNAATVARTWTLPDKDGTVAMTSDITGTNTGTNTGDQTITLTGDVTGSGTGSFAATIANDAVTYAKMQNVSATSRVLGRITAGAGDPEELTGANLKTIIGAISLTADVSGVLPVANGGSGQTVTALSISSGVVAIDLSLGNFFTLALSANVTSFTFSNAPGSGKGFSIWIEIVQNASAAKTVTLSGFKWAGGIGTTAVSTGLSAVDELALTSVDNGTTVKATLGKAFA